MRLYVQTGAEPLAEHLSSFERIPCTDVPRVDYFALYLDSDGLALLAPSFKSPYRLTLDECVKRVTRTGLLSRAIGAPSQGVVLDACAGLGVDGFGLAALGFDVLLYERQPALGALLHDFTQRHPDLRANVVIADSYAAFTPQAVAVVYLDPMFDKRRKTALPNRGMQHLQQLAEQELASETSAGEWLAWAEQIASQRIVLKRRRTDPVVGRPSHQLEGRSVRLDVYQQ